MTPVAPPAARRRRPASLQGRLTVALAGGGLALSLVLALIAYTFSRSFLVQQFTLSATRQVYGNARLVRDGLLPGNTDVTTLLTSVAGSSGSESVVEYRGRWYASSLAEGRAALPVKLRDQVTGGTPARERFVLPGAGLRMAIGIPLPAADAAYFEIFSLGELARTLHTIALGLIVAAAATAAAGGVLGSWMSRRLVRPVREVARASSQIARGEMDTRLTVSGSREVATLSQSFNEMADALQRRIERDARFAADVSHELRSPLTTMAVTLSVLEARRGALPERAGQALGLLGQELRRFQRLVQDLLEMARAETAPDQLSFDPVSPAELVLRVCSESLPPAVPVDIEAEAMGRMVRADKRRLERVMVNLFDNATRHAGGVTAVRLAAEPGGVRLSVEDAGPGVPEADRSRIFEPFARGEVGRERTDGAGLGLAMAKEHVLAHGGRLWVEPGAAGGSRFVLVLPDADADD